MTDEEDPFSVDETPDPFRAENGFVEAPASSRYSADFIQRVRAAQLARVERIDQRAKALLRARAMLRKQVKEMGEQPVPPALRRQVAHTPIFSVWRTDADLRCWDVSIDPSDRTVGTLWGQHPFTSNMRSVAFARLVTPESWLSTWSGISSNASFEKFGHGLTLPTLMLEYTGDQAAFPSDMDRIYQSIASVDKSRHKVRGNHHGLALVPGETSGQVVAGRLVQEWLGRWRA